MTMPPRVPVLRRDQDRSLPAHPARTGPRRRRWLRHFPIGLQVLVFVTTLAVVVIGSSYRSYVESAQTLIRHSESENLLGAALVAQARIEAESRILVSTAQALARHPAVREALKDSTPGVLDAVQKELDTSVEAAGLSTLDLIDRHRVIVHRAPATAVRGVKASAWGVSEALAGEAMLQTAKEASGGLIVRSIVPVPGADANVVVGVVMAGTRFDNRFAQRIARDSTVELAIATPIGVVARSSDRFHMTPALHQRPLEQCLFERRPVLVFDLEQDSLRQYVPVRLGDETFVLIIQGNAQAAQSQVVAAAREATQSAVTLFGLAIVAAGLFAALLGHRLRQIRTQAEHLARDITGEVHVNTTSRTARLTLGGCELDALEHVFDHTARSVARHHEALHRAKVQAEHAADSDPLTGLPNRGCLMRMLSGRLSQQPGQDWALLFLDLDGFKQVNDQRGHDIGDALLREASERLVRLVGCREDVTRLGGDEFVLIAHADGPPLAPQRLAQKIIHALEQPFHLEAAAPPVQVSASIGIALHPEHGRDASTLLKHADMALYAAKGAGRRTFRLYGSPADPVGS
jgi:diguanylate cyclase (GGDEF)-like protein